MLFRLLWLEYHIKDIACLYWDKRSKVFLIAKALGKNNASAYSTGNWIRIVLKKEKYTIGIISMVMSETHQ
jgi:hypothetical protein